MKFMRLTAGAIVFLLVVVLVSHFTASTAKATPMVSLSGRLAFVHPGKTYTANLSGLGTKITFKAYEVSSDGWIRADVAGDNSANGKSWLNSEQLVAIVPAD